MHEEDSYNNATKENSLMPKVAIFFSIILLSSVATNSYAFVPGDMVFEESIPKQIEFNSDIIQVDSDFFVEKLLTINKPENVLYLLFIFIFCIYL